MSEAKELREALEAVICDILEYEQINKLYPGPGRQYCWDSVANAVKVLNKWQS